MRRYETIVILKPSLGEAENQAIIDRATGTIEEFEGSIVKIDKWGLRKTAYPIMKETQGYYVYIQYAGQPAAVDEMERVFRIDEKVMKYLTVKLQDVFKALPEDEAAKEAESEAAATPEVVEEKVEEKETAADSTDADEKPAAAAELEEKTEA